VNLKTSNRQVDGITIVDCSGRITLGEGSVVLRDSVKDLLSKGQKKILLNLGDVNYIDSSGIGELIGAFTAVRKQGGDLLVRDADPLRRSGGAGHLAGGPAAPVEYVPLGTLNLHTSLLRKYRE
jgi:anti-anti-sigma factor